MIYLINFLKYHDIDGLNSNHIADKYDDKNKLYWILRMYNDSLVLYQRMCCFFSNENLSF